MMNQRSGNGHTDTARYWDDRYRSRDQMFSGAPNAALVAEAADLTAGRALDVGCGEGADALWLARRGWQVTGVDVSQVALDRAAASGADVADRVTWTQGDVTTEPPPHGPFDLVSIQYFPLPHHPDHAALRALLNVVAPGGTFLFVGHDSAALSPRHRDYYQPAQVAELLDDGWTVLVNETRPRASTPAGTNHTHDTVMTARLVTGGGRLTR